MVCTPPVSTSKWNMGSSIPKIKEVALAATASRAPENAASPLRELSNSDLFLMRDVASQVCKRKTTTNCICRFKTKIQWRFQKIDPHFESHPNLSSK
jgi:hypothetical protein